MVDILNGIENTISGPALEFQVDPTVAARAGFTPEEVELDASAILQGEPATTPVVVNDRAYTIRVRFPDSTRVLDGSDPQHAAGRARAAAGQHWGRSPHCKNSLDRRRSAAKTCSA